MNSRTVPVSASHYWYQHLAEIPGVVGRTNVGSDACIHLLVRAGFDQLIPKTVSSIDGREYPVSCEIVEPPEFQGFRAQMRPIKPGASISVSTNNAGTVCAKVTREVGGDRKIPYLLSCEHVLCGHEGTTVLQPAAEDGGNRTISAVATLSDRVGLQPYGVNDVDAAIARLNHGIDMVNVPDSYGVKIRGLSRSIKPSTKVVMYGRSSGRVEGEVVNPSVDIKIGYKISGSVQTYRFRNVARCNYINAPGDSGAAVVDANSGYLLGMHIGGDANTAAYFCHASVIFRRLNLSLM